MKRKYTPRPPHHGPGGSQHIGRTRIRLAGILSKCLDLECEPEDLRPAGGRQRNNTTVYDGYAWEVFTRNKKGLPFVAGSFDTMTDCVKAGAVYCDAGEIRALWQPSKREAVQ